MKTNKFRSHKNLFVTLALICGITFLPATAFALSLRDAKAQGLVGEQRNGYLGTTTPNPSDAVKALVSDINGKRRAEYQGIAARNGTPLTAVEKVAAEKAINMTPKGQFYQNPQGAWVRK